ncbi:MAG: division/cell wall cluster transcriptional repressor MraZ [Clostridia bacterium]|nr:division/cell wall cluster transcriptional repressor MraZ [Clostridia bacterium]
MLFGEFKHAVDAKNRLFIPAKFREQLGESFIVIRSSSGEEHYLTVYSQKEWAQIEERLAEMPRTRTRDIKRFWGRNGLEVSPDTQGRILLTQALVDYTGLDKSAVVIGCGEYAEIWSEAAYERMVAAEDAADFEQQLLELGV